MKQLTPSRKVYIINVKNSNWTIFNVLLTNEHSLTYNQNESFAFFFETLIKAAIQVLRFKSQSVYYAFTSKY